MNVIEGLVPQIGTKGKYILLEPWLTEDDVIYSCERVSSLLDYKLTSKIDVLQEIYINNGLTEDDYNYAIKNNIKIVTLKSDRKDDINLPDNYIKNIPDMAYVPYEQFIISLNLGLLPNYLDFSSTLEELESVISKTLNVTAKPILHNYEANRFVDWATHVEMEEARKSGIKPYRTLWEQIEHLKKRNKALSDAILELEDIIKGYET